MLNKVHPPIELTTDRLILRKRSHDQVPEMFNVVEANRQHLRPWMPWEQSTKSVADQTIYFDLAQTWWNDFSTFDYTVFLKTTNKIIGSFGIHSINWNKASCDIGFWLAQEHQGKGYISEIVKFSEELLRSMGFHRVVITCDRLNQRSANVARKSNFILESLIIDDSINQENYRDTLKFVKLLNLNLSNAITENLPAGFNIRELDEKTFWQLVTEPIKQTFNDHQFILTIDDVMTAGEVQKHKEMRRSFPRPYKLYLCVFKGEQLAGWSWGYQDSADSFYMVSSAILPEFQGRKLYSRLLETVIQNVTPLGLQRIWSRHHFANNAIIATKLKRNFVISAFELNDMWGNLLQLTYYFNANRKKLFEFRTGQLRPDEQIKKWFKLD